jgi:hypothetical protein
MSKKEEIRALKKRLQELEEYEKEEYKKQLRELASEELYRDLRELHLDEIIDEEFSPGRKIGILECRVQKDAVSEWDIENTIGRPIEEGTLWKRNEKKITGIGHGDDELELEDDVDVDAVERRWM